MAGSSSSLNTSDLDESSRRRRLSGTGKSEYNVTSFGGDKEECVRTLVGLVTNVTSLLQIICQARHRIGEVVRHRGRV